MKFQKNTYPTPTSTVGPAYFETKGSKSPLIISWDQVYELITKNSRIEAITREARQYRDQGNPQAYSNTKARAGAITPAAQCQGGHNATDLTALTGVSMVDLDHVPIDRMALILKAVKNDPHTFLSHVTCSGEGIRILFRYTSLEPQIAYRDAWEWGNHYYAMLTGADIDQKVSDVTRLSFLSHDPLCHFNPQSSPFAIATAASSPLTTSNAPQSTAEQITLAEQILERQGVQFYQGNRHYYLMQMARLMVKMGIPPTDAEAYATARMTDDPSDALGAVRWVYNKFQTDYNSWQQKATTKAKAVTTTTDSQPTPNPRSKSATPAQIRQYLETNELMRYNVIADTVELWSKEHNDFVAINDRTANTIWQQCIDTLGLYVKDADFEKVLKSEFVKAYNPFEEYFANLPAWDGQDHLGRIAQSVTTTTDPHIFNLCFRRWMVGMVASWLDPKVINETILTLIGGQGMYKSTFFRELLPPQLAKYFMAKGNSSYITKDDRISVSNYGLIALEEIDSLKDSDLNAVKALVTMETIDERAAYARNREKRPHLASFCATGNNKQFLTDLSGNRRWLPFEVESITDPRITLAQRDQLYAQVHHLIGQGYRHWFTRDEDLSLEGHKREFTETCVEEDLIRKYFRKPDKLEVGQFMSSAEIAARCNADLRGQISHKRITQVMKLLGYKLKHTKYGNGFIVVPRTYEEISMASINTATDLLRQERALDRQLTIPD